MRQKPIQWHAYFVLPVLTPPLYLQVTYIAFKIGTVSQVSKL